MNPPILKRFLETGWLHKLAEAGHDKPVETDEESLKKEAMMVDDEGKLVDEAKPETPTTPRKRKTHAKDDDKDPQRAVSPTALQEVECAKCHKRRRIPADVEVDAGWTCSAAREFGAKMTCRTPVT